MVQLENPYMTHMHNYSMGIPAPTIHTPKSKSLNGDAHSPVLRHPLKFKLRANASNSLTFPIQKKKLHVSTSSYPHHGGLADRGTCLVELLPDAMAHYLTMTIADCLTSVQDMYALVVLEQLRRHLLDQANRRSTNPLPYSNCSNASNGETLV